MNRNTYDDLIDNFELYFPTIAKHAVHWYPSGRHCITIVLDDGTRTVYDDMLKTMRNVTNLQECDLLSEDEFKTELGRKLRSIMADKGIGQSYLADISGVTRLTISKYMNGTAAPTVYNLIKLARALDCAVSELIDY